MKKLLMSSVMLTYIPLLACATHSRSLIDDDLNNIIIDQENLIYIIDGKEKKLGNCETDKYNCFIMDGISSIAMFKICDDYYNNFKVEGILGNFNLFSPSPHLSGVAGSFYNTNNDKVLFHYSEFDGLYQIDIHSKNSAGPRDNSVTAEKYTIRSIGGRKIFVCE